MSDLYSIQAEQELLGAIFKVNDIAPDVIEGLKSEDFYALKHQLIFSKITSLWKNSKAIDPITVYESLTGGEVSLTDLLDLGKISASPTAYKTYMEIVKDNSNKRKLKDICENTLRSLDKHPSDKLAMQLNADVYALADEKVVESTLSDEQLMAKTIDLLQLAISTKGQGLGMKIGWKEFDAATNGFVRGDFNIIAARPSLGKTCLVLNLMDKLSQKGFKTVIFELEMTAEKLGLRRVAMKAQASLQRLYKGNVEELEMTHILAEADKYSKEDMVFTDCTPNISLLEIRNKVRKLKMSKGLDVVFIDHIGLMRPDTKAERRDLELSDISRGLKAIAKDYGVCVIALSQLNRAVESRQNKRPMLSDLRESGSLEADSDLVIGLYRDGYYDQEKKAVRETVVEEMELIILKNRDGRTGTLTMNFDSRTQLVSEIERWEVGSK